MSGRRGDGYTLAEMARGTGKYETDMRRRAAEAFFSVYPYSAYRSYFDVYMGYRFRGGGHELCLSVGDRGYEILDAVAGVSTSFRAMTEPSAIG